MIKLPFLFGLLLIGLESLEQTQSPTFYNPSNKYYSATDFNFIDTLERWNYDLYLSYRGKEKDSIKPIGKIIFFRTNALSDKLSRKVYGREWTPVISFDIYNISDSAICSEISRWTRIYSSCVPPDVGGDLLTIGKYIFLNRMVCLACKKYDTNVDYCRPIINYIFSKIDVNRISTISDLVDQLPIKKSTQNWK